MKSAYGVMRERRRYNQWVANETLEDFALRYTARRARRWSYGRVANTALGSISFLALEAIGGAITLTYGFDTAITAIMLVGAILFLTGFPISYYAARYGVDIDLLTRGAGFGYIGSTVTSLIYASFTFIFFALEAAILSLALELCFSIPLHIGYILNALVVIPLVTHGFSKISRFQAWTQPFFIVLQLLPFAILAFVGFHPDAWTEFRGTGPDIPQSMNLLMLGAASGVVFSLIAQIGEQVDFLRFLPEPKTRADRRNWWTALICAGPGWAVIGVLKMLIGSYLLTYAIAEGKDVKNASEPTQMYHAIFAKIALDPIVILALTGTFVILAQLKINVTNAYAGSIAWSNFFSRLTHSHPGRVVWMVFNVLIALMLMELGVFRALEATLALYSHIALAWIGALVADLVVNKQIGLSPSHIEFRRAHLYDINPVGLGAMAGACLVSLLAYLGLLGTTAEALSSFIALATALILAPLIAIATQGRYYIARPAEPATRLQSCCVCEYRFDPEDVTDCPFYEGPICSLCCSLDSVCHDACKPGARLDIQAKNLMNAVLPKRLALLLQTRMARFIILTVSFSGLIGGLLMLIRQNAQQPGFDELLTLIFAATLFIVGVSVWLFLLAHESQSAAWSESRLQTQRLMREVRAHERTDAELQKAKERAEAANLAKSRYMMGLSHELRTPLNAIFGYAQILDNDPDTPPHRGEALATIRRSAEHLSGLIEGLLDISKIEAGRLDIYRDHIDFQQFLSQLSSIFRIEAEQKGLSFVYEINGRIPHWIAADEKRLRQILMNLLSNAIRYTDNGEVRLTVSYRNEVAQFEIADTGCGISDDQLKRIWNPFERGGNKSVRGTGLGLTITRLLVELLGGEIQVESEPGMGSRFLLRMMLPTERRIDSAKSANASRIAGYAGPRRSILLLDDETDHLRLIEALLAPLGFKLYLASGIEVAEELLKMVDPDLFILDIDLPGKSGWAFAADLRRGRFRATPIVMVSAHALEGRRRGPEDALHDAFISKPISLSSLLEQIRILLKLTWLKESDAVTTDDPAPLSEEDLREILAMARIGNASGVRGYLEQLHANNPELDAGLRRIGSFVSDYDMPGLIKHLESSRHELV